MSADKPPMVKYTEDGPIIIGTVFSTSMLDGSTVTDFGAEVIRYVESRPGIQLMLNFENVDYLSSAALTELIKINDAVVGINGAVRLCGLSPDIQKVFAITKFDQLFEIKNESVKQSVARFKRSVALAAEEQAWEDRRRH